MADNKATTEDGATTMESLGYVESWGAKKFFGKYRGTVINNADPYKQGRLLVQIPDVLGLGVSSWASQCLPFGGLETGMYVVPPINAGCWVEFEQGNSDKPIVVGYWWGSTAEVPKGVLSTTPFVPVIMLQTLLQSGIVIQDAPYPPLLPTGGVLVKSGTSSIAIGQEGITITAPTTLTINAGSIFINGVTNFNGGALVIA